MGKLKTVICELLYERIDYAEFKKCITLFYYSIHYSVL